MGCFFVLLGALGVVLPILPTTPFMLLALGLFANSSPRFHQMLLDNPWFGTILKQWEESKTVTRQIKINASLLLVVSFSISIILLLGKLKLQVMLALIGIIFLVFIWKLKERQKEAN